MKLSSLVRTLDSEIERLLALRAIIVTLGPQATPRAVVKVTPVPKVQAKFAPAPQEPRKAARRARPVRKPHRNAYPPRVLEATALRPWQIPTQPVVVNPVIARAEEQVRKARTQIPARVAVSVDDQADQLRRRWGKLAV